MALHKIPYTDEYFLQIRDFLVSTYDPHSIHPNWHIDRWNFCRHVSQTIHETVENWPAVVGLWVDEKDAIQAVVNSEGENRGEVFFQLARREFTDRDLGEFIDFAEDNLSLKDEGSREQVDLHAGPDFLQLGRILLDRGYKLAGKEESGILEITGPLNVVVPDGMRLVDGPGFSDERRGLAHSLAFGYAREDEDMLEKYHIVEAFANMRLAPDYRSDLDLAILDQDGQVAAFANFWFDEVNKIGILEPLGTIPVYQEHGLASALLSEGVNRLLQLGANRLYGGAGQPFYEKFGFEIVEYREIWQKKWSGRNMGERIWIQTN